MKRNTTPGGENEHHRPLGSLPAPLHASGAGEPAILFETSYRGRGDNSALTTWAPAVDIYETENELVLKADLPDVDEKDLDIQIENNMLTIRGERKFNHEVKEDNYLRIERTYGAFSRSFSLPNTVNPAAIKAEYKNGVLRVELPKRAESKPRQVKVNVANGS